MWDPPPPLPSGGGLFVDGSFFLVTGLDFSVAINLFLQNYHFPVAGPLSIVFYAQSLTEIIVIARL